MSKSIRTYQVEVNLPASVNSSCKDFTQFVINQSSRLLSAKVANTSTNSAGNCFIQLQVQCFSYGKNSINSFCGYIRSEYPSIKFITGGDAIVTRLRIE